MKILLWVSDGNQKTPGKKALEQTRQEICGNFETIGKVSKVGTVSEVGAVSDVGSVGKVSATGTAWPAKCGSAGEWCVGDVAVDNAATTRQDLDDG